jgi:hypothetical protein
MERWNSARRLFEIAEAAQKCQATQVPLLWASVFAIDVEDVAHKELVVEVASRLVWINEEIDLMLAHFRAIPDFAHDLYEEPARHLRAAASPMLLSNTPEHVKKQIKIDVTRELKHLAQSMPSEESKLSGQDIQSFEQHLEQMRAALTEAKLDPLLRAVIFRHIRLMQRAIDAYPVFGVRAFEDALKDALGELWIVEKKFAQAESEVDQRALKETRLSWASVAQKIDTVQKFADLALAAGKLAKLVIENIPKT